jgi:hypothetical protein
MRISRRWRSGDFGDRVGFVSNNRVVFGPGRIGHFRAKPGIFGHVVGEIRLPLNWQARGWSGGFVLWISRFAEDRGTFWNIAEDFGAPSRAEVEHFGTRAGREWNIAEHFLSRGEMKLS